MAVAAQAAHTRVWLIFSAATARPGETVMAGVHMQMDDNWHTYWKNPGASGAATKIQWQLPTGVTAGEIQWPIPEKTPDGEFTTYIYEHETVLLVPLQFAADLKPGTLQIHARVSWLECEQLCVPGNTNLSATLEIAGETKPSANAALIRQWQSKLPAAGTNLNARATWEKPASGDSRSLVLELTLPEGATAPDFFPGPSDDFEIQPQTEIVFAAPEKVRLRKSVKKFEGDWPDKVSGLIVFKQNDETKAFDLSIPITAGTAKTRGGEAGESSLGNPPTSASQGAAQPLGLMLVYAFLGGLILNVMPCVFPVIALKILGFVQQSHDEPRRVLQLGIIYGLGVLASFLVMAGIVIGIKQGGGAASWGMQFRSPHLSVVFIVLVVLIALNLFGVFEINLGGRTMNAADQLASKPGASGAFFNGVLATVLATPCTAPILATALGFAFAQPPLVVVLFFFTIGLGLAFPYVLLSWKPAWLKFLPRPGAWMERFKKAMGFPMLATAVWIFWFTAPRFGEDGVIWIGFFLIGLAFAVWVWGEFVQRGRARRGVAMVMAALVLLGSYGYALEAKLHWRTPVAVAAGAIQNSVQGVQWQPWSAEAVAAARNEGKPILVDFTAKWCLTCNKFVKPAVDNPAVRQKLEEINGVALLADNTNYPEDVMREIYKYHSDGAVPLVLVYPRDASKPPEVLPTIPSRKDVLEALDRAMN